jgi:hypothetical protein
MAIGKMPGGGVGSRQELSEPLYSSAAVLRIEISLTFKAVPSSIVAGIRGGIYKAHKDYEMRNNG